MNNFYHRLNTEPEFEIHDKSKQRYFDVINAGPDAKAVARAFRDRIDNVEIPIITFDLHEVWYESEFEPKPGFFVRQYARTMGTGFAETAMRVVEEANLPIHEINTEPHSIKYFSWNFTEYSEECGAHGLVQESPILIWRKRVPIASRVEMHIRSIDGVIRQTIKDVLGDEFVSDVWAKATAVTLTFPNEYSFGKGGNPTKDELIYGLRASLSQAGVVVRTPIVISKGA